MIRIYTSSVIDAPADSVWGVIRDFNALHLWHPLIADSRIENGLASDKVGCVRNFRLRRRRRAARAAPDPVGLRLPVHLFDPGLADAV